MVSEKTRVAKKAIAMARRYGRVTRGEVAGATGVDGKVASKVLKDLVAEGSLEQGGLARGTFYTPTDSE